MDAPRCEPGRFRVLAVDGGGIRGVVAARVIAELEERMSSIAGEERRIADCFHLLAGTSTGGLIALALSAPDPAAPGRPLMSGPELVEMYLSEGPEIFPTRFRLLRTLLGYVRPKWGLGRLRTVLERHFGDARLSAALREVVVTAYDVRGREPRFFKRWTARSSAARDHRIVEAGLATAAAPTYFPALRLAEPASASEDAGEGAEVERLLVDGGVFANDPTVAAIAEALKRQGEEPAALHPHELLVVSIGNGHHEVPYPHATRWGSLGWILPRGGESPLLATVLDGQADAADHWAHMLVNHEAGDRAPQREEIGRGPRYFRFQVRLGRELALDDARPGNLQALSAAAEELIEARTDELDALARTLAGLPPLPGGG